MISKNKATTILFIFLLVFLPGYPRAKSAGYGEENENLGQFTDDFENSNNVSVIVDLIRNSTLNCIELNRSTGVSYENYTNNVQIIIESDRLNDNLTDFPILIRVSDSSGIGNDNITGIFDEIGNSYQKIAITDESLGYEYYIDVEQWSLSDRLGALWIAVNVSSIEDVILYLHFGSTVSNNSVYVDVSGTVVAQNVWDEYFIAVYHMRDQTANTILDSTSNNLDGVKTANDRPEEIIGLSGLAQEFDPNEGILLDDYPGAYTDMTLESFFQCDDTNRINAIIALQEPDNQIDGAMQLIVFDNLRNYYRTDGVTSDPGIAWTDEVNWHYFANTRDGANTRGYPDGILDVNLNGVVGVGTIQDLRQGGIGSFNGVTYWFDGTIDEVRVSSVNRGPYYINATNFCLFDDLVNYGGLIGSGPIYEPEGYLTTTDYLDYALGSSLALLTNATILNNTEVTAQFSNDNNTWVDHEGNIGSDILETGFYALDLRDLNYTDIYLMYNFSTSDGNITPRLYQSRLITTLGPGDIIIANETIVINNVTGEWIEYNLTEIGVLIGTHDSGFLNSTFNVDGNTYDCSEVAGAPGYVISFNWTDVDTDAHCLWVSAYIFYDGVSSHVIDINLYNFDSETWVTIGYIYDMADFEWVNSSIYVLRMPNDYINSTGAVLGRFYHSSPGNINDDITTDYLRLHAFIAFENGITAEDNFFWVFIAIVLSIITALLVWMKYGDSNN